MRSTILAGKRARTLRRSHSLPETVLWQALRGGKAGGRFRRQHPMGVYILDFYCPAARLAVELDGEQHASPGQALHDARRDAWLTAQGVLPRIRGRGTAEGGGGGGVTREVSAWTRPGRRRAG